MQARRKGFTIVELTVTTSIIAVVASVTLPGLRLARISGNEAAAISTLRSLDLANQSYRVRYGSFPADFAELESVGIIDEVLAEVDQGRERSGYLYTYTFGGETWNIVAAPSDPGTTGERSFWVDHTGVLRQSESGPATGSSTPLD